MNSQNLVIALVVGLLIGAVATYTIAIPGLSQTTTATSITTTTTTTTETSVSTTTVTAVPQLDNVTFYQIGACSPPVYTVPWSVTLGNKTESEPPNATLPITGGPGGSFTAAPWPSSLATIVFSSVPNGVYHYTLAPIGPFYRNSGTVTVNGTDVSVPVEGPAVSCVTSTRAT